MYDYVVTIPHSRTRNRRRRAVDEIAVNVPERVLIGHTKDDDVRTRCEVAGARFSRGMRNLRALVAARKILANNDVVS